MSTVRIHFSTFLYSDLAIFFSLAFFNQSLYLLYQHAFKYNKFFWLYYLGLPVLIGLSAVVFTYLQSRNQTLRHPFSLKAFGLRILIIVFLSPILYWRFYQLFLIWRPLPAEWLSFIFLYRWKILPIVMILYFGLLYLVYRLILAALFIQDGATLKTALLLSWKKTMQPVRHQLLQFFVIPVSILVSPILLKLFFIALSQLLHNNISAILFLTAYLLLKNGIQLVFLFYLASIGNNSVKLIQLKFTHLSVLFSFLICCGCYSVSSYQLLDQHNDTQALTISHRGVSADNALQNSLTALKKTHAEEQPDFIEMDIQETSDHHLVVMHDENLKKLANIDARIDELSWDELKHLALKENGYQESIPLFSDYLKTANEIQQKLLIELKVSAKTKNTIVQQLLPLRSQLEQHQFQSMDLETAEKIKQAFPKQQVGYILPFDLLGSPRNSLDFIAIESRTASNTLIQALEQQQQDVYVWPVNSAITASAFRLYNANGLISDDLSSLNKKNTLLTNKLVSILLLN